MCIFADALGGEENFESLGAAVMAGWELPNVGVGNSNSGLLKENKALLTTEPSFQHSFLKNIIFEDFCMHAMSFVGLEWILSKKRWTVLQILKFIVKQIFY